MSELADIEDKEDKELKQQIDDYYTHQVKFGKIIKRVKKERLVEVDFILQKYEKDHSEFVLKLKDYNEKVGYMWLIICKEEGTNEIYFSDNRRKDVSFVEYFKDIILYNLNKIEEFYNIFKLTYPDLKEFPRHGRDNGIKEIIDDDFLKLEIIYDTRGRIHVMICIEPTIDQNKIYSREWMEHESIASYVNKNEEALLKRIPINIIDLKPSTQAIIIEYYNLKNQGHQLKLK